jgi:gamma-D-glutamyl-L-lysine dipeptidyl-peptidase
MSLAFRTRAVVVLLMLLAGAAPASSVAMVPSRDAAQVTAPTSPELTVGRSAWVAVAVARLWESPSAPWPVDAPALRSPVRFRAWLRHMTFDERKALDTRSDTEALLGDRVVVVRLRPHWVKVVVPSQPSQKDSRGYPGWIPRGQLTARTPSHTGQVATVIARTAWLRTDDPDHLRGAEISFGTALSVLGQVGHFVRVVTPQGAVRRLYASTVVLHTADQAAIEPSRASLKWTAESFLGLPYLWGGLSGFGIDCSGLTWLDYRAHGIRIPRDALPQSRNGRPTSTPRVGDLLFYASNGLVHHVSMSVGGGYVIDAPHTGGVVEIVPFSQEPLRSEYSGARRYLP